VKQANADNIVELDRCEPCIAADSMPIESFEMLSIDIAM